MKNSWNKSIQWSIVIAVITLVLAAIFSIVSTWVLAGLNWAAGMAIVFLIVFIGVFFDMIGVAATAANETPFNSMAAKKIPGAYHAMVISRNADRVASFCADVIGDISGIISGTATSAVVVQLALSISNGDTSTFEFIISVIFTSIVAALTVGGKAVGKTFAITFATSIIYQVGRILYLLEVKLKIKILTLNGKQNGNKK